MEIVKIILQRLKSKSPKLFAWLRNIAILLIAVLGAMNSTSWGINWMPQDVYNLLYGILAAIAGTAQMTTTDKELMNKDKNHK